MLQPWYPSSFPRRGRTSGAAGGPSRAPAAPCASGRPPGSPSIRTACRTAAAPLPLPRWRPGARRRRRGSSTRDPCSAAAAGGGLRGSSPLAVRRHAARRRAAPRPPRGPRHASRGPPPYAGAGPPCPRARGKCAPAAGPDGCRPPPRAHACSSSCGPGPAPRHPWGLEPASATPARIQGPHPALRVLGHTLKQPWKYLQRVLKAPQCWPAARPTGPQRLARQGSCG
mmetsp:Transcript_64322/g.199163  ORF Transcript_64322/g.199163 Transcript_64322/m.199163 type:complete len:227 (-) Transcript_64322:1008-1688(-)